jgi:sodium/potassium-transporting ATPase subunit alpha
MVPAISMAYETAEADIMQRPPRNAKVDRLVTKKLVSFAYLQIGVIQAISGFFTWLVVLNDYGYAPHILPGLGAVDSWGKQQLYCQTTGGTWRDFKGKECPCFAAANNNLAETTVTLGQTTSLEEFKCAPVYGMAWWENEDDRQAVIEQCKIWGYAHWDQDTTMTYTKPETGKVMVDADAKLDRCDFAPRNFKQLSNVGSDAPSGFSWQDGSTYFKDGLPYIGDSIQPLPTKQSIEALVKGMNYNPYTPYRAVTSVFFNRKFGVWDVSTDTDGDHSVVNGVGSGVNERVLFNYQPLGMWDVYESARFPDTGDRTSQAGMGHILDTVERATNCKVSSPPNGEHKKTAGKSCISEFNYYNGFLDQSPEFGEITTNLLTNVQLFDLYDAATDSTFVADDNFAATAQGKRLMGELQQARCTNRELGDLTADEYKCYPSASPEQLLLNVNSRKAQKSALSHGQSASFIAIIIVQWADLVICKTRWLSIRQQGMKNAVMNFALVFELLLGALLCYVPGIPNALGTMPLRFTHWFPAIPFSIFIFLYDETRKYLMRSTSVTMTDKTTGRTIRDPGWLERNTYY